MLYVDCAKLKMTALFFSINSCVGISFCCLKEWCELRALVVQRGVRWALLCCAGGAGPIGGTQVALAAHCHVQGARTAARWTFLPLSLQEKFAWKIYCLQTLGCFLLFVFVLVGFYLLLVPNLFKIFIYFILCFRTPMERLLPGGGGGGGVAGHALQVGGKPASCWKVPERWALQGGRAWGRR